MSNNREDWPVRLKELVESCEKGTNAFHFLQQPQQGIHDLYNAFMSGPVVQARMVTKLARHMMTHHDYFGLGEAKEDMSKATSAAWSVIKAWGGQKQAAETPPAQEDEQK